MSLSTLALTGIPATVDAQAWVPAPGEGTVSLNYQTYDVWGHYNKDGIREKHGSTFSQSAIAAVDIGLPGAFAVTASLPFIATKFTGGPDPYCVGGGELPDCVWPDGQHHGFVTYPGIIDDGTYHQTFQDLHFDVRRMWAIRRFAVTPFAGVTIPTHEYVYESESATGKYRRDYRIGASVGTSLDPLLRRAYAHARYSYAAAQVIENHHFTRSLIEAEGGWSPPGRIGIRGLFSWQIRHKAPKLPDLAANDRWRSHDRFIGSNEFIAGGGPSVAVTRTINAYALWTVTPSGSWGAHVARTLTFGMSLGFGGSRSLGGLVNRRTTSEPDHVLADAVNGMRQFQ